MCQSATHRACPRRMEGGRPRVGPILSGPTDEGGAMIDPLELANLSPEAQRAAVIDDLAIACERALAVLNPDDPLVPGLARAAAGFRLLGARPRSHLQGVPRPADRPPVPSAPRPPLLRLLR